jgi:hypothetical protein
MEKLEQLKSIELYFNGKLKEYKLRIFTAKVYAESLKILRDLKQSEVETELAQKAIEYKETENINLIKDLFALQQREIDVDVELHNYLVFCKLINYNLEVEQEFVEDFWLEQDKEKIEQFITYFRRVKKLSRI